MISPLERSQSKAASQADEESGFCVMVTSCNRKASWVIDHLRGSLVDFPQKEAAIFHINKFEKKFANCYLIETNCLIFDKYVMPGVTMTFSDPFCRTQDRIITFPQNYYQLLLHLCKHVRIYLAMGIHVRAISIIGPVPYVAITSH